MFGNIRGTHISIIQYFGGVRIIYIIKMYNNGLKVVYTSPLKALTAEIVEKLIEIGFNVLEDTGDFRKDPLEDYEKCDVLSTTYERFDSVITNPNNHSVLIILVL